MRPLNRSAASTRRLEACEDVDLCRRLLGAGWRIVADEKLVNVHLGDPATLQALFRAERWRGRDNMKVSLRPPVRLRELPGIIIPPLVLVLAAVTAIGLAVAGWRGSWWIFLGAAVPLMLIPVLKVLRMAGRAQDWSPFVSGAGVDGRRHVRCGSRSRPCGPRGPPPGSLDVDSSARTSQRRRHRRWT